MKTPCEERGWEVGDKFMVINTIENVAERGDIIELVDDDGDDIPFFRTKLEFDDATPFHIDEVEKIDNTTHYLSTVIKQLEKRVNELEKNL